MANRIRFTTAQQVVEAFPKAADDFEDVPEDATPLDYLALLAKSDAPARALTFAGLALPKREAVWWACVVMRNLGFVNGEVGQGLALAEAWVKHPEEEERRATGNFAEELYFEGPGAWICFAAFTTSGSMAPAGLQAVPPSAEVSGKSAAFSVIQAIQHDDFNIMMHRMNTAIECAREFAEGGNGLKAWEAYSDAAAKPYLPPDDEDDAELELSAGAE